MCGDIFVGDLYVCVGVDGWCAGVCGVDVVWYEVVGVRVHGDIWVCAICIRVGG